MPSSLDYNFLQKFHQHYDEFVKRYNRYKEVYNEWRQTKSDKSVIDLRVYIDILIVGLRSLCIESPKLGKNYTVQNFLSAINRNDLTQKLNSMLDSNFCDLGELHPMSIRNAIKTCSDNYVCHYDHLDFYDGVNIDLIFSRLTNPYFENNFENIINIIIDIMNQAYMTICADTSLITSSFSAQGSIHEKPENAQP